MKRTILCCMLMLTAILPACRTTRLVNPKPVPAAPTPEKTRDVVLVAMNRHDWTVQDESPGVIHAKRDIGGKHSMTVAISWDDTKVSLAYEDSRNLKYDRSARGRETIHKNYMTWVKELMRTVKKESARAKRG